MTIQSAGPQTKTSADDTAETTALGGSVSPIAGRVCPMCRLLNPPDAIFCTGCNKALGEFKYVREELEAQARWHETLAERVTGFIGRPHFLVVNSLCLVMWIAVNSGLVAFIRAFDPSPFGLLGILLGAEAIFISGFVLISQNRQNAYAGKRAELDYEVSVSIYRAIHVLHEQLHEINARLERLESSNRLSPTVTPETRESP